MAGAKSHLFPREDQLLSSFARALAHPARIKILKLLNDYNGCIVSEIVNHLPLAQSTVSQHLNELKKAGLIYDTTEGTRCYYCLNKSIVSEAKKTLNRLFSHIHTCC